MDGWKILCIILWILSVLENGSCLPINRNYLYSGLVIRLKRDNPFDPPTPVFPAKENAPFWNPPPYPIPTTAAPLRPTGTGNSLLDSMTDPIFPNFGIGYGKARPTIFGGSINWPTGNPFHPTDNLNGTLGFAKPTSIRLGMQGGPLFPWQSSGFRNTADMVSRNNIQEQEAQARADAARISAVTNGQNGVPTGFMPVQQSILGQDQSQFMPQSAPIMPQPQQTMLSPHQFPAQSLQPAQVPQQPQAVSGLHRQLSFAHPV